MKKWMERVVEMHKAGDPGEPVPPPWVNAAAVDIADQVLNLDPWNPNRKSVEQRIAALIIKAHEARR